VFGNDVYGGSIAQAVIGGTASELTGGKFANGAITAAFGYLYNFCTQNGCFDRRFNLGDAIDQYRNGDGSTVTDVNASELNLTDATYSMNPDGSFAIHTSLKFDTGAIYGTVTGYLNADGTLSIRPDYYNFERQDPDLAPTAVERSRIIERNRATALGRVVNGRGTPYEIRFSGSIPAPDQLSRFGSIERNR